MVRTTKLRGYQNDLKKQQHVGIKITTCDRPKRASSLSRGPKRLILSLRHDLWVQLGTCGYLLIFKP